MSKITKFYTRYGVVVELEDGYPKEPHVICTQIDTYYDPLIIYCANTMIEGIEDTIKHEQIEE